VPATKTRHVDPSPRFASPSQATADSADLIFTALGGLHGLTDNDADLLRRAAAGLRFIQSVGAYSAAEHDLFLIALAELPDADALVVEAAACYAADVFVAANSQWRRDASEHRRALWFAAVLRLADALCTHSAGCPDDVYAAWTAHEVFLEFDGGALTESQVARARTRVAALEAVSGRTVLLARSSARRGAA
jgi:hypothetical protein